MLENFPKILEIKKNFKKNIFNITKDIKDTQTIKKINKLSN